jgi:prolyl oligopeptidase
MAACSGQGTHASQTPTQHQGATETLHGVVVSDPFRWLEKGDSPEVQAWVTKQDRAAREQLSAIPARAGVRRDLESLRAQSQWPVMPHVRNGHYYYQRIDPSQERGAIYEYDPTAARESVVLNLDAPELATSIVSNWTVSPNAHYLVAAVSKNGNDETRVRVFDLLTKKWLAEDIPMGLCYPAWDVSGDSFYHTWAPADRALSAARRAALSEVRHHVVGTDAEHDERIRPASNEDGVFEGVEVAPGGDWVIVMRFFGTTETAISLSSLRGPKVEWQLITGGIHSRFDNYFAPNGMYMRSDEGAPNGRLFRVDLTHPTRPDWQEVLPTRPDAILSDVSFIGQNMITGYQKDAETVYEVRGLDGSFVQNLAPPRPGGTMTSLGTSAKFTVGSVEFATYTDPYRMFLFRPPTFELEAFDPAHNDTPYKDRYITEKVFYTSPDGSRAPIFLVRARSTPPKSNAPLLLQGYGAFGIGVTPGYAKGIETWLDRGGVFAEVVLRGGNEYGSTWHQAGMLDKRPNVYRDFIAASEYVLKEHWTAPGKLVIHGGSAGGLLVTMAMVERPELYAGVIASVPVTDMIRYPLGGSGPLWFGEFGSPEDPKYFPTLLRYSPYHRVKPGVHYPPLLVLGSADDDRVDPMHARKFVAAVQSADPTAKVLLRTEKDAAHYGPNSVTSWADEEADLYAFALSVVGIQTSGSP